MQSFSFSKMGEMFYVCLIYGEGSERKEEQRTHWTLRAIWSTEQGNRCLMGGGERNIIALGGVQSVVGNDTLISFALRQ